MGVVGCYHLGRRKRTEKFQLKGVGEDAQVIVKSRWQEPAVFSLTLPLLSAAANERSSKQVNRSSKLVKRSSRRTEHKFACERIRQEQSKRRKAPEEERFVRTVVGAVCLL